MQITINEYKVIVMVYAHSHFAAENGSHSTKEINILYNLIVHFLMLTSVTLVKLDTLEIDVSELRLLANSQSSICTSTIVVQSVKI